MAAHLGATRTCAHRGDSAVLRENTLPAIRSAIDKGATFVEIDVRLTADGDVVVLHDATLERLWGDDRPIDAVPTAQLARFGDAEHRPPLLRDVLAEFAATPSRLVIDMEDARFAAAAYEVAAASGVVADWCGHLEAMRVLRALSSSARLWLPWRSAAPPVAADLVELAPVTVNAPFVLVDDDFVSAVHELGQTVTAWTVDDDADLARAVRLGIDTVTTNRLDRLQTVIAAVPVGARVGEDAR
ncbi:glycerophosphodiester phosphodiesterase [Microbacterium hominis]|uniref:glycerophosphodiester phosphodiesterase n=1 Tax=Microbacterium hominis TaxID=162426 RepID=UPI00068C8F1E|nr:glycerophosphodiester phosphodiesterase family protein [Microbacterium hominis]